MGKRNINYFFWKKRIKKVGNANTMTGDIMKMNKVNGIRIFVVLAALLGIGCYQIMRLKQVDPPVQPKDTEQIREEVLHEETQEASIPVSQIVDYKFVIVEEGDYLTVYLADRVTVYEYTGIRFSELEEGVKERIREGYCVKDEEALFGFLENYSS